MDRPLERQGEEPQGGYTDKKTAAEAILVVDDDRATRKLVVATLAAAGFDTVEASSGNQALALLSHSTFGCVVLDNHMAGISGLEVLEVLRAKAETRTLPVILLTGDEDTHDRVVGLRAGASDYVTKPFRPEELLARICVQLRDQRAWAEVIEGHIAGRAAIAKALCHARPEATPEATAQQLCSELGRLGHLSGAAIVAFLGEGVLPLAHHGLTAWSMDVGKPLRPRVAAYLRQRAEKGPWIERLDEEGASALAGGPMPEPTTLACAPLDRESGSLGVLILGADPPDGRASAASASRVLSEAIDYGRVASGLLGPSLVQRGEHDGRSSLLEGILRQKAFKPVFQPVVDLVDGRVIGYEALTRFADGGPPEERFQEAARLGLGIELELATLDAALTAAGALPRAPFLSVNVSPELVLAGDALAARLVPCERRVVLELTEHDRVDDYGVLRRALDAFGDAVDVCVDDAGSGFASLRHVLAIRPQFVKLDQSWIRDVHADPARQSLVAGLGHFSRATGSRLIAEGIEGESERAALEALGVELGQGFLFGRPEPAVSGGRANRSG